MPPACQGGQVSNRETSINAEHLSRRREAAAAAWNLTDGFVVIGAGEPLAIPGRYDNTYPFRSHSEYFYLTDRERPGGVLAFDPKEGWFEFLAPVNARRTCLVRYRRRPGGRPRRRP
jgi:Xaa-Pro aminopeptidase